MNDRARSLEVQNGRSNAGLLNGGLRSAPQVIFLREMLPEDRLGMACVSYQRALAAARRRSSPATWRSLVTAAKNLGAARRDREKAKGRARDHAAAPAAPRLAPVVSLRLRLASRRSRAVWAELNREWERAQTLITRATALVQEARLLDRRRSLPAP